MQAVPNHLRKPREKDFPYFRRLWNYIVLALMSASFVPLILIGGGMYYYSASLLKEKMLESLSMEVVKHQEAIDQFLAERTMDLNLLSKNLSLADLIKPGALKQVFRSLREELPCFQDLGIIDDQGRHLAYIGPFDLISKNYKDTFWFKAVMEREVYISDVFSGFRHVPHFIIAVKQVSGEGVWIMRATVDAAYFDAFVSKITDKRSGEAFLVNRKGIFQTSPRKAGKLMEQSEFKDLESFEGIKLEERKGQIRVMIWLHKVPWLSVVQMDRGEILKLLHRVRNLGIFVFVLGAILIAFTVLLTTNHLVERLEIKRKSIRFLDKQLRHTSKMASSMQLSSGFSLEIKDILANIDIAARWIQDLTEKDLTQQKNLEEIRESLEQIKSEALRSRKSIEKILSVSRTAAPIITDININSLLDDIIELFDRELRFNNIKTILDYYYDPPSIRSDPSQVSQVFLNLIVNAVSAVRQNGMIMVKTRISKDHIKVAITDDGPGIPEENIEKIFDPFFTTKPDGMGLGLPICRNILEKLGGTIVIRSKPGEETSVIVELPFQFKPSGV